MIKRVEVWILWDLNNEEACNHDGSEPVLDGDKVWIKDLICNCSEGCGGCDEEMNAHLIGDNDRFYWRKI